MTRQAVIRLIDANANRALEGVRVCEEIIRFHVTSPRLFKRLRALRHTIARTVNQLPLTPRDRLNARDSTHDIGRRAKTSSVASLEQLLLINFQRVKESLRTLEECTRLFAPRHSSSFAHLRFHTYEVERDILIGLAPVRHR